MCRPVSMEDLSRHNVTLTQILPPGFGPDSHARRKRVRVSLYSVVITHLLDVTPKVIF